MVRCALSPPSHICRCGAHSVYGRVTMLKSQCPGHTRRHSALYFDLAVRVVACVSSLPPWYILIFTFKEGGKERLLRPRPLVSLYLTFRKRLVVVSPNKILARPEPPPLPRSTLPLPHPDAQGSREAYGWPAGRGVHGKLGGEARA